MIYVTGDIHGDTRRIEALFRTCAPVPGDTIILLGDVGLNYHMSLREANLRRAVSAHGVDILCVHGNHERRPEGLEGYAAKTWNGGTVWYTEDAPHLLFAKDGDVFTIEGHTFLVIGGAYSPDKYYRLSHGHQWFPDEQPSDEIKRYVEARVDSLGGRADYVLSHTCPYSARPLDRILPAFADTADDSTELWLDTVAARLTCTAWFCGHWHIERTVGRYHFLYRSVETV